MLLEKAFYKVDKVTDHESGKYTAFISLNKDHEIFLGHFPDNPVTPGACMIQIIKELTRNILGYEIFMKSTGNVKFMALINPEKNQELILELDIDAADTENIKVKNVTRFEDVVALKMSNVYKKIRV